jgi:hypothetical protein
MIRKKVFETNSSSSHSISISEDDKNFLLDYMIPDDTGTIELVGGEFGWEWERYTDAETKANYFALDNFNDREALQDLADIITEQTGAKRVLLNISGYIDHQSVGTTRCLSKAQIKNFIFNKKSILYTGNDNSDAPSGFYE